MEADFRRFHGQHLLHPVSRLEMMRHHGVEPGLALRPGGDRGIDTDNIAGARQLERDAFVKSLTQVFAAEGDQRAAKAWNIEALGRRVQGYRAGGDLRPEGSKG